MNNEKHPSSQRTVVESYCRAWFAGDAMAVLSHYHEDLSLTWPGRHHLAGDHIGQDAAITALLTLQSMTNRVPIELIQILEGERSVIAMVIERWTDPINAERTMEITRALEFTVADNKLRTCRIYEADQPSIDEWIEAASPTRSDLYPHA